MQRLGVLACPLPTDKDTRRLLGRAKTGILAQGHSEYVVYTLCVVALSTHSPNEVPAAAFKPQNLAKVDGHDHVAAAQIYESLAPHHKAQEVLRPTWSAPSLPLVLKRQFPCSPTESFPQPNETA